MTSSNIRNNKRLLMFSALIALAYSFPTETESGNGSLKNASETTGFTDSKKTTMVHVEEKIPESESVVVEFIYNGNNKNSIDSKGKDKDKYVIDSQGYGVSNGKTNSSKSNTVLSNQNTEQNPVQATKSKSVTSFKTEENTGTISLSPEENSSISGKWPKYFYEVFNPVQPFPELEYTRPNQIDTKKIQRELSNSPQSHTQEQKVPLDVAGPPLNPLSIYEREFRIPIFD